MNFSSDFNCEEFAFGGRLLKQPLHRTGLPVEVILTFVAPAKWEVKTRGQVSDGRRMSEIGPVNQPSLAGAGVKGCRLGAGMDVKFFVDPPQVGVHRVAADEEFLGNFLT